jgi:hypothetical protein
MNEQINKQNASFHDMEGSLGLLSKRKGGPCANSLARNPSVSYLGVRRE